MRTSSRITFNMSGPDAESLFARIGMKLDTTDTLQAVELFKDSPEYRYLVDTLNSMGVKFGEQTRRVYSMGELEAAQFLVASPLTYSGHPLPDDDFHYREVSYDPRTGCPNCQNGMTQIAPLRLRRPGFGKNDVFGLWWVYEPVVTPRLKNLVEREGFTGCDFWPVLDHRSGRAWEGAWQLVVKHTLTNMHPTSGIARSSEPVCDCGRRGFNIPGDVAYRAESLGGALDFNRTAEWFGATQFTRQLIIVSNRVFKAFRGDAIRGFEFEPVSIIGSLRDGALEEPQPVPQGRAVEITSNSPDFSDELIANRSMPDMKQEIFDLLEEHGLSHVRARIARHMKESIRVIAHNIDDDSPPVGSSRIGGLPDVPEGFEWPVYQGEPLSFIAQLRLSDLAALVPRGQLPKDGLLSFFFDSTQMAWGFSPQHRDGWKVAFFEGDPSSLKTARPPATLPEAAVFAPCRVEYSREYTIPPFGSADYTQLRLTEAHGDAYFEMMQQLQESCNPPVNRAFGYPDQIQGDVKWAAQMASNGIYLGDLSSNGDPRVARLERGVRDWVLLLQIDSDSAPGMMWGDEGRLYFTIKERDLKAGKFENVWCELQCG